MWIKIISSFRRKGDSDSFNVNEATKVCEFHFKITDIKISFGNHIKSLVRDPVPIVFSFNTNNRIQYVNRLVRDHQQSSNPSYSDEAEVVFQDDVLSESMPCQNYIDMNAKVTSLEEDFV